MKRSSPILRRATREDIEKFSPLPNKPTILAWVGELDGEIIGIGGLAYSKGRWFAFCDLKEEARKHKMTIARAARKTMNEARNLGIRFVYADMDKNEPMARKWFERLGFEPDPRSGYLYRWRG